MSWAWDILNHVNEYVMGSVDGEEKVESRENKFFKIWLKSFKLIKTINPKSHET